MRERVAGARVVGFLERHRTMHVKLSLIIHKYASHHHLPQGKTTLWYQAACQVA